MDWSRLQVAMVGRPRPRGTPEQQEMARRLRRDLGHARLAPPKPISLEGAWGVVAVAVLSLLWLRGNVALAQAIVDHRLPWAIVVGVASNVLIPAAIAYVVHLRRVQRRLRRYARGECVACGYGLRGIETDRCPECGTAVPLA